MMAKVARKVLLALTLFTVLFLGACKTKPEDGGGASSETNEDSSFYLPVPGETLPPLTTYAYDERYPMDGKERPVFMKIAREASPDGWVFSFVYEDIKEGHRDIPGLIHFWFSGINIRYKYNEKYAVSATHILRDGSEYTEVYEPGFLGWGMAKENEHDAQLIDSLLYMKEYDDIIKLKKEDLDFTSMDVDFFWDLMQSALNGPVKEEGIYLDLPTFAVLQEPNYLDGYKFQVGFMHDTGLLDELFLDVIYKTGDKYNEYVQLSDMVDEGTASEDQVKAYQMLKMIEQQIKSENLLIAGADTFQKETVAQIDFSRLYTMLNNLHNFNYTAYISSSVS